MAHEHRYYMQSVKKEFEPYLEDANLIDKKLFVIVEYAYMFCSGCLSTLKIKVKDES